MDDLDLSDIDPLKWAEVRRRAQAVRNYIAIEKPTAADRERFGAMLGLGAQQFSNLVKAWLLHKNAEALSPGQGKRHLPSRSKTGGVDPRAREAARVTVQETPPDRTLRELVAAVRRRCVELGVNAPSSGTIWLLAVEARAQRHRDATPTAVLIARAFLRLPVDMGNHTVFPELTVALELPNGRVIGIAIDRNGKGPNLEPIIDTLESLEGWPPIPIKVDERDDAMVRRRLDSVTSIETMTSQNATRLLASVVGRVIGRLELAFKPLTIRPTTVMQSGRDRPLTLEDAELALKFAVTRHNESLAADRLLAA